MCDYRLDSLTHVIFHELLFPFLNEHSNLIWCILPTPSFNIYSDRVQEMYITHNFPSHNSQIHPILKCMRIAHIHIHINTELISHFYRLNSRTGGRVCARKFMYPVRVVKQLKFENKSRTIATTITASNETRFHSKYECTRTTYMHSGFWMCMCAIH